MTNSTDISMAQQIARAAVDFEQRRTGHGPESITVTLGRDTMVITLHGALSPAEKVMAQSPEGTTRLQEYHRQLFQNSSDPLRQEICRITGVAVRDAAANVETVNGSAVQVFPSGTMVQVFLLDRDVPVDSWSGTMASAQAKI